MPLFRDIGIKRDALMLLYKKQKSTVLLKTVDDWLMLHIPKASLRIGNIS